MSQNQHKQDMIVNGNSVELSNSSISSSISCSNNDYSSGDEEVIKSITSIGFSAGVISISLVFIILFNLISWIYSWEYSVTYVNYMLFGGLVIGLSPMLYGCGLFWKMMGKSDKDKKSENKKKHT